MADLGDQCVLLASEDNGNARRLVLQMELEHYQVCFLNHLHVPSQLSSYKIIEL